MSTWVNIKLVEKLSREYCQTLMETSPRIVVKEPILWASEDSPTGFLVIEPAPKEDDLNLAAYDSVKLNAIAEAVVGRLGWMPLSKRYGLAKDVLDALEGTGG